MNPEEQEDLEAVFGKDAADAIRRGSDRRAEGYARRKGSALPDMRRGKKPTHSKYQAVPIDRDNQGRGQEALEVDRPDHARPKARDRFREPRVEPVANRKVRTKSGKSQSYQVALTAEEYAEREAKLNSANVAALDAARAELEEAATGAPLALPISEAPPSRFRSVDADVRRYAAQTELRARPRPVPIRTKDIWTCHCCGQSPCVHSVTDLERELLDDEPELDSYAEDDYWYRSADHVDDRSQWELDHADAIAEDAAAARQEQERMEAKQRAQEAALLPWLDWVEENPVFSYDSKAHWDHQPADWIAGKLRLRRAIQEAQYAQDDYAAMGVTSPPAEPFEGREFSRPSADDRCVHCGVDPMQTQKDGLCRNCKTYKTKHAGGLPPQKLIDSRKRKRESS